MSASESAIDMTEQLLPSSAPAEPSGWFSCGSNPSGAAVVIARPEDGRTRHLLLAAWIIALSSFMWGYGAGALNVCIVPDAVGSLLIDINLSTAEQETATALVVIGAVVSAVTTGSVGDHIGLKKTILLNNAFFVAGGIICALATSKQAIYIARFLTGYAEDVDPLLGWRVLNGGMSNTALRPGS